MEYVGIYNRCSTEEECQVNALAIQAEESVEIVNSKKDWVLVEQYIESQSGTSSKKRVEYLKMLEAIEERRFTVIVIKSIDRLARNTKDWYLFLDCIARNNVKLYIYLDNKYYSPDDSLIMGIKAILAEEFSRELSKKIKNAHRRRQEKCSGYNITCEMFGWNKLDTDVYEINEDEASMYRLGFELAEKGYGFRRISNVMYDMGVRSRRGQKISDVQWRKMLRSPRAHGAMVLHSTEYDFEAKKRRCVPKEEQIVVQNVLPPIVSKEYQDRVLELLDKRALECNAGKRRPSNRGRYELSGKLVCKKCGKPFYRCIIKNATGNRVDWKCSTAKSIGIEKDGKGRGCIPIRIDESELYVLVEKAYVSCEHERIEDTEIVVAVMKILRKTFENGNEEKEKAKLQQKYEKLKVSKEKLLNKLLEEVVSNDDFLFYSKKLDSEMDMLKTRLEGMETSAQKKETLEQRLRYIENELLEGTVLCRAKQSEFLRGVDKIWVYPDGMLEIVLRDQRTVKMQYNKISKLSI